jgi:hypothetical protein
MMLSLMSVPIAANKKTPPIGQGLGKFAATRSALPEFPWGHNTDSNGGAKGHDANHIGNQAGVNERDGVGFILVLPARAVY